MSEFHAEIDPRDLLEFHICMENLNPERVLEGEWGPFLRSMQLDLKEYPPMLPNQKYKRTFNLRNSWLYAVLRPTEAEIGNAATYAGWVQGERQAAIHQGRWSKMREIGEEAVRVLESGAHG